MTQDNFALVEQRVRAGGFSMVDEAPRLIAALAITEDVLTLKKRKGVAVAVAAFLAHMHKGPVDEVNAALKVKAFAEWRLGKVLAETVQPRGRNSSDNGMLPEEITPMQSSRAQQLAGLEWDDIEAGIDAATDGEEKAALTTIYADLQRKAREKEAGRNGHGEDQFVLHGDFRTESAALAPSSVSLIFTDPPYDRKSLPLYGDLASVAARLLRPGGSLLCYCGHYVIPEIIALATKHLRYYWCCAVVHTGGLAKMREYGITVGFKPLLWFTNGPRTAADKSVFVGDCVISGGKEKGNHAWEQSAVEALYYIEKLTVPGELVFDPFAGSGTTLAAAVRLERQAIGTEAELAKAQLANGKVSDAYRATHGGGA